MYGRVNKILFFVLLATVSYLFASFDSDLRILGIRVDFPVDDNEGTTGNGKFILSNDYQYCDKYVVDPPPHDKSYFESQLKAVDSYYSNVSNGKFGIDLNNSAIFPNGMNDAFTMPNEMAFYHPLAADLSDDERKILHEERVTQLFYDAVTAAYQNAVINFNNYDIVVIFHAGIGQDFSINLDTTPEDIPSTYIDFKMLREYIGNDGIYVGEKYIKEGIILPETQNHILYPEMVEYFQNNGIQDICGLQFGLTGIFSIMIGQTIGLPPLWNTETGQSGVGVFGLMDQGSNNGNGLIPCPPTAWSRIKMGWEEAEVVIPNDVVEVLSRPNEKTVKVDINESEYFLIENRTNWFRDKVNIDSVNINVYNQTDTIPNLVKLIFDSVGVEIDENGVIVSVPDYDIGLPGSGLLIWHIDENIIDSNISDNSINNNSKIMGVDLEEAGGSQDLGYASTALFRDPSSGEPFDMWYSGNPEYNESNSISNGQLMEFSPFTNPNTRSNNGANSNLTIGNIGNASDTMQISISNNLTLSGFSDSSLHIIYHTDFDGDGSSEVIGGTNELWWSESNEINKKVFYSLPSNENYFTITNSSNNKNLVVLSVIGDSLKYAWFEFDGGFRIINEIIQKNEFDYIDHIAGNNIDQHVFTAVENTKIDLANSKSSDNIAVSYSIDGGIIIGKQLSDYNEIIFDYISAIDLDIDGKIDVLALDNDGNLYGFNQNYTYSTGFPLDVEAVAPILAKDIFGDQNPEIIFKNQRGELIILNSVGELQYSLSGNISSKLIMIGEHNYRNTIVTESNIWVFDELSKNGGNEWTTWHGDDNNSRTIEIDYLNEINVTGKLFDKKKTYVYPNPIRDDIAKIRIFNYTANKVEIKIYDSAGYFVKKLSKKINENNQTIEIEWNVNNIESGVYLINLTASNRNNKESIILKVGVIH